MCTHAHLLLTRAGNMAVVERPPNHVSNNSVAPGLATYAQHLLQVVVDPHQRHKLHALSQTLLTARKTLHVDPQAIKAYDTNSLACERRKGPSRPHIASTAAGCNNSCQQHHAMLLKRGSARPELINKRHKHKSTLLIQQDAWRKPSADVLAEFKAQHLYTYIHIPAHVICTRASSPTK